MPVPRPLFGPSTLRVSEAKSDLLGAHPYTASTSARGAGASPRVRPCSCEFRGSVPVPTIGTTMRKAATRQITVHPGPG